MKYCQPCCIYLYGKSIRIYRLTSIVSEKTDVPNHPIRNKTFLGGVGWGGGGGGGSDKERPKPVSSATLKS